MTLALGGIMNKELYHFGIKGMKWGVRRYRNYDGTYTEAGKKRYGLKPNASHRQIKKALKRFGQDEWNKVGRKYENELIGNEQIKAISEKQKKVSKQVYSEYAKEYNRISSSGAYERKIGNPEQKYVKKKKKKTFDEKQYWSRTLDPDIDSSMWDSRDTEYKKKHYKLMDRYDKLENQKNEIVKSIASKYVDEFNSARLRDLNYQGSEESGKKLLEEYGGAHVRWDGLIDSENVLGFRTFEYYPSNYYDKRGVRQPFSD